MWSVPSKAAFFQERRVQLLLGAGFLLMVVLLGTDGYIGFRSIDRIRQNVSRLTEHQFRSVALIDEVQRVQLSLSAVLGRLLLGEARRDRDQLEEGVASIEQSFKDLFASIPPTDPDIALWRAVERAAIDAVLAADRVLDDPYRARPDLTRLIAARDHLTTSTTALILASHRRAENTRLRIEEISSTQRAESATLLAASLLLAIVCASLVVILTARFQQQMTEQAAELGKVSWQLLERQENLARRLSHELHDELGQSLTALKTNFSRVSSHSLDPQWMEDCSSLLRDSIRSAHEISQLLRPTILDDFGLDSALAWLCERFEERNHIHVHYQSSPIGRLDPQTETHVFRIAQEALTNIAKHARATRVEVSLRRQGGTVHLRVADNGKGVTSKPAAANGLHFGITGMKARARSLEGALHILPNDTAGTIIELEFPWKAVAHEEEDPHPVG